MRLTSLLMLFILMSAHTSDARDRDVRRVLDFEAEGAASGWFSVDDGVMGGLSHGHLESDEEGLSFFGRLSLENNGGFSSVRSPNLDGEFSGADRLRLLVRGDGRQYQLCLKKTDSWNGVLYRASFDTLEGEWMEVDLPLSRFQPRWRGRLVERAGPIAGDEIAQLGFMLADKQPGDFQLDVKWVGTVDVDGAELSPTQPRGW